MRILYDSKQPQFKTPFGTLTPGQVCTAYPYSHLRPDDEGHLRL